MTFTADQYAQIAQRYDSAAADPFVPNDKKQEFAKQAEWFHYLSERERGKPANAAAVEVASERPRPTYGTLLTALWLTGAAVYLIGTLLFTNAVSLFGDGDKSPQISEVTVPVNRSLETSSVVAKAKTEMSDPAAIERRHAVSPDQPPYEAPELITPLPVTEAGDVASLPLENPLRLAPPKKRPLKKADTQKRPSFKQSPKQFSPKPSRESAGLPDDAFFVDRGIRRRGLVARRKMLRQGLMSPGFLPPE